LLLRYHPEIEQQRAKALSPENRLFGVQLQHRSPPWPLFLPLIQMPEPLHCRRRVPRQAPFVRLRPMNRLPHVLLGKATAEQQQASNSSSLCSRSHPAPLPLS
jgi:hypothetical protein